VNSDSGRADKRGRAAPSPKYDFFNKKEAFFRRKSIPGFQGHPIEEIFNHDTEQWDGYGDKPGQDAVYVATWADRIKESDLPVAAREEPGE
jgi:hypothetical protein